MTILYNCHTDGDQYRITKFNDGEVESTYLCSTDECQCPAGHRPSCRHRLMLPMFIDRGAMNSFWFLDWERKGWVSNEPAPLRFNMDYSNSVGYGPAYIPDRERSELDSQQIEHSEFRDHPELILGGFPWNCYNDDCITPTDCIMNGCIKGNGTPPRPHSPMVTTAEFDSADGSSILPAASTKPSWRRI